MTAAGLVAFNLLLNGVGSFGLAWLLTRLPLRTMRKLPGKGLLLLLALPFLKLAVDLAQGVPDGSFLWMRAQGQRPELGSFMCGFGLFYVVPRTYFALGALYEGQQYSQSAPDLFAAWLMAKVGSWAPLAIASGLFAWAGVRLARRAFGFWRAWQARRAIVARAVLRGRRRVGWGWVAIYVIDQPAGSPYAAGLFNPYVCFPLPTWQALTKAERRAALAHELAHVAEHHLLWLTMLGVIRDVFWFVPGIGRGERAFREGCELAADARAVQRGTPPVVLASALVRSGETTTPWTFPILCATGANLKDRVDRLLSVPVSTAVPVKRAAAQKILHLTVLLWVAAMLLVSTAFGNH